MMVMERKDLLPSDIVTWLRQVPLFGQLDDVALHALGDLGRWLRVRQGDDDNPLHGMTPPCFYIVCDGEVELLDDGRLDALTYKCSTTTCLHGRRTCTLTRGDHVGTLTMARQQQS